MVRRRKKAKKSEPEPSPPKPTYHKSKNGRYYKKTKMPSGKCQTRFCSKVEAEGGLAGSSVSKKQPEAKASDT